MKLINFYKKSSVKLFCLRVLVFILFIFSFLVIKINVFLFNEMQSSKQIFGLAKQQLMQIKVLIDKSPLLVSQIHYQDLVGKQNQRIRCLLWFKKMCDLWLCQPNGVSNWSRLSIIYHPKTKQAQLEWGMQFQSMDQARLFKGWLKQEDIIHQVAIISIDHDQYWKVSYKGVEQI